MRSRELAAKVEYKLKRINKAGVVDEVLSINVVNDGLAFAWGRMFSLGDDVEVWRDARQLTTISSSGAYRHSKLNENGSLSGESGFDDNVQP